MRQIFTRAQAVLPYAVEMRRRFHTYPECGPAEQVHTMETIERELAAMGIDHVRVAGGGVLGFIGEGGVTLLLRSDIDALPIQESENNLAGKRVCVSAVPGVMHGCGHDAHTAMLLAEAKLLKEMEGELPGRVVLLFEEGEEGYGNIQQICRYIQQNELHIDGCYAAHTRWDLPTGQIGVCGAAAMAGLLQFDISIDGRGGHGSRPDLAANPIDCFHHIFSGMDMLRMRFAGPDVGLAHSVCMVQAGSTHNVIPEHLKASGTVRFTQLDSGRRFLNKLRLLCAHSGEVFGCSAALHCPSFLLPTLNSEPCAVLLRQAAGEALGAERIAPCDMWMASDSFCYMSSMYPSVYAFVGIRNEAKGTGANHHQPTFDVDEDAMAYGVAAAVSYALAFLASPPDTSGFQPACADMDALLEMMNNP